MGPLLQHRLGLLGQEGLVVLARLTLSLAQLPLASEQGTAIEVGEHLSQGDLGFREHVGAPEGRRQRLLLGYSFGAVIVGGSRAGRKGISRCDSISGSGLRSGGSRGGFAGSLGRSRSIEP